jgi:phage gp45-like
MPVGIVKSSEVTINRDGVKPVRLLQVEISDPDDIQTVELYSQAGEDYNPPVGSTVFIVQSGDSWKIAVACDDGVVPTAGEGERILYAVAGGVAICQIHLKVDGSVEISNSAGSFVLSASGQVNINNGNFTVDP